MMSYDENILDRINQCFEIQLDRVKEYKKNINLAYEKIIYALENNNDVDVKYCYENNYVSDDKVEYEVNVSISIDNMDYSIYSIIRQIFETIDSTSCDRIKNDHLTGLDKKNIEYGKTFLNDKFKEYFSKCNFEYTNSIIRISDRKILEMHFVRKERYSDIV